MGRSQRLSIPAERRRVRIEFEGEPIEAHEGESIAAALLASGVEIFSRAVKYHRARGAYCLAGRCAQCVMRVDGEPNVQTCTVPVRDGMKVERQNAFPSVDRDIFASIDWMYPRGLDHHSLFAGVPVVEKVVAKVAREMAGLGTLPSSAHAEGATFAEHETDVVVVGAGSAGLSAARAAADEGATVLLVDEGMEPGGRLRSGLFARGSAWVEAQLSRLREAGVHVLPNAVAFGLYRQGDRPLLAVRAQGRRLLVVRPGAVVVATGATEPLPPFGNNDLPGVFAGRGLARMIEVDGVLPGRTAVVAGEGEESEALSKLLMARGCEVVAKVPTKDLLRARGRSAVAGAVLRLGGAERKVRCELIAVCETASGLVDLARHGGAHVDFREGYYGVRVDDSFRTDANAVFACGEAVRRCSPEEAARHGEIAGRAAAATAKGGGVA